MIILDHWIVLFTVRKNCVRNPPPLSRQEELKKLRVLSGQINCIATQTRPYVLYEYCKLTSLLKNATAADVLKANKVFKKTRKRHLFGFTLSNLM